MKPEKKPYLSPAITEVKFEDKNLVLFLSCSKQTKIDSAIADGCCQLMPEMMPAASYDPS